MEFLIVGLLVIQLAVTVAGFQLLARENRRRFHDAREMSTNIRDDAALVAAVTRECLRNPAAREALYGSGTQPDRDQERGLQSSKAFDEGLANIMSYSVGKVPGVEFPL
ncbi:hypothetical protein [uncultured Oscillibacter sp.]|uniref:hypothetical protein n=1 Tax=uncultured Oscillibacter sp. TaxID=876091 RepID=UPI002619F269|nr:hypothetical protein [uncultured Oscillibacter sp.]